MHFLTYKLVFLVAIWTFVGACTASEFASSTGKKGSGSGDSGNQQDGGRTDDAGGSGDLDGDGDGDGDSDNGGRDGVDSDGDGDNGGRDGVDSDGDSDNGGRDGVDGDGDRGDDDLDGDDDGVDDLGLDPDEDEFFSPRACTGENARVVRDTGGGKLCPKYSAAFLSDDGNGTRVGCCRLPSNAIFDRSARPEYRGTSCGPDEIAVGAKGRGFICQRINTKRYRLSSPQRVCYWGSGHAGSNGSRNCSAIIAQLQELIRLTGDRDGCAAYPYGAVITHKTGKDCGDQQGSQIIDLDTGAPVRMFP